MTKNLLALLMLLVLTAVAAKFTRRPSEDPRLASLRRDAEQSLKALWPNDSPQVELVSSLDGMILIANQHTPAETPAVRKAWSYDVLALVTRRHPPILLAEVRVIDSGKGVQRNLEAMDSQKLVLLSRQHQAEVDRLMPPGTALVLLDLESAPVELERKNRAADDGHFSSKAMPYPSPIPTTTTVWMLVTQEPPAELLEKLKPNRVVRLPKP